MTCSAGSRRLVGALGAALGLVASTSAFAKEEPVAPAPTIALESVALPIVVDGALVNYVFISIKLELTPKSDGAAVRAKEQFIRDDLVRVGHRTPFTRPDDYTKVDEVRVKAEVMRAAVGLVGPGVVKDVLIIRQASQKVLAKPQAARPKTLEIVP